MSNYQYNIPYPYDSGIRYDGYYLDSIVSAASSAATGFTYSPAVSLSTQILISTSFATGFTYSPAINIIGQILVNASLATGFTWSPIINTGTEGIVPGTRLYDGYPKPEDTLTRNIKISVVGGKLAYKLTDNYWTTKL